MSSDGDETVWVVGAFGGRRSIYHTNPDCPDLEHAEASKARPRDRVEAEGRRECRRCADAVPVRDSGDTNATRRQLLATDAREVFGA